MSKTFVKDDDANSLNSDERDLLDNNSWDTSSDEEQLVVDEALCQELSIKLVSQRQKEKVMTTNNVNASLDSIEKMQLNPDEYESFYDFYMHDLRKNYFGGVSQQYQIYQKMMDKRADGPNLEGEDADSYEVELEEMEVYKTHKAVIDAELQLQKEKQNMLYNLDKKDDEGASDKEESEQREKPLLDTRDDPIIKIHNEELFKRIC